MLAFLRGWHGQLAEGPRMAQSLALHAPGELRLEHDEAAIYAQVPGSGGFPRFGAAGDRQLPVAARLPSGDRVLFSGWFDNLAEVAATLGIAPSTPAHVYGHAVLRWGDAAELHVVGAYAAVVDRPHLGEVRLARSPITAPPLHWYRSERMIAAACVPRALLALGIPAEFDRERLALHLNATPYDCAGGWYKGIEALQLGTIVTLTRTTERRARPYSLSRIAQSQPASDRECQKHVEGLLREAIDRTVAGHSLPGTFLTGGLDSTIVASHLLDRLPAGHPLPSFTFVNEPDWQGEVYPTQFADERPGVEAFAAMHPRIEPHFCASEGKAFGDDVDKLFLLTGVCPNPIGLLYPYHAMFAAAKSRGCDLLIGAGMGNSTFSNTGQRGFVEYVRRGNLRQAWRANAGRYFDPRPVWRRFLSLSLLRALPLPLWRGIVRMRGSPSRGFNPLAGALNPDWPGAAAMTRTAMANDPGFDQMFYRNREEEVASIESQMDADATDAMQGFQQLYGVAFRDVTRYRPLVEYCLSLPVEQFLRDGQDRHLARRMGNGRLPDMIRNERRYGFQHADWHQRLGRRRGELLAELRRMEQDPDIAALVDLRRLTALLENFPASPSTNPVVWHQYVLALPTGLAAGRFIRFAKGSNA